MSFKTRESSEISSKTHSSENLGKKRLPVDRVDLKLPKIKQRILKVENADVAKFLHGDFKLKKLKPLPDLNKYKNDPFLQNPLLKFKLSAGKSRRVYEFLEHQAVRNKIKTYKECIKNPVVKEPLVPKSRLECYLQLRKFADAQPTVPLQDSWIQSIQGKLHCLHLKFPSIASNILEEVRGDYYTEMHQFGVSLLVKLLRGEKKIAVEEPKLALDSGGKTARYNVFLKRRSHLKATLHMLHPLQRKVYTAAVTILPQVLADFSSYRDRCVIDLETLMDLVMDDIKRSEHLVITSYYGKVANMLAKNQLKKIPVQTRPKFLSSVTNILRVQITNLIYRSIEHILWVTGDKQRMPSMSLSLVCDGTLSLFPSRRSIYNAFHSMVDNMAGIAQNLTPLETWLDGVPVPEGFISICVNVPFLEESHAKLEENLVKVFEDVSGYMKSLEMEHEFLFSRKVIDELRFYISQGHTFEELFEKRQEFQEYVDRLGNILANEYFSIGCVSQYDLIKCLKELSGEYCFILMEELLRFHVEENQDICSTFLKLKEKALKEPESTEELMDMGVFMLSTSGTLVSDLEERIGLQLRKISVLIHLDEVPLRYINLMSDTVNWITEIKPVFELNSAQYEQHKFEFEERLQKRTEQLGKDLDDLGPKLVVLNNMDDPARIHDYLQEVRKFLGILEKLDKDVLWINHEESLFKFPASTYPELDELHNFITPFAKLLFLTDRWQWKHRVWMNGSFQDLEANIVESTTEMFYKEFLDTQKMYKAKIKQQIQDNVARRFKGNVDDPDPNNIPVPIKICNRTIEQIKAFKTHVPLIKILCNKALMLRHWQEMSTICGFAITPDFGTTLRKVVQMDLTPFLDQFEIISIGAGKELQLGENLKAMWNEWKGVKLTISAWKDSSLKILSELDEVQALLDDHLAKTITMRGSAFVKPFEKEVKAWYNTLDRVNKTLDEWGKVQVQWLYLLPIFSSKDICAQMVEESMLFNGIDSAYKKTMENAARDPRVLETAGAVGLYETFLKQIESLDRINSGVNDYLEKKRLYFPRFFFLSNDEMLEILSETKDPLRVQPHLRKCFEGISKLDFDDDLKIGAMISSEGEVAEFDCKVSTKDAGGSVEKWLVEVETQMKASVHSSIRRSFEAYTKTARTKWIREWLGQVVLAVSSIYWTAEVHAALQSNQPTALKDYHEQLKRQLNDTVAMVRGELPLMTRTTLGALIVIDVHAKDTVEALVAANVKSDKDFSWLAQLRYYWNENQCIVRMVNASIGYAYEYLGNTPRLVITPLTDRCYRTLIGAYCLHLNGAPEGPAGTGKTETTKDLAKALAVQCIVFNCSDGLDYIAMGKFFKGLACCGAWACFDEFNRIELEVLSVVAQQILCIMRAVQTGVKSFLFEGTQLNLNPACYVCITMNPGYAGRSELPDNLKVLFRTVAMMVPDYALIAEISLYSYGFDQARPLAVKIVTTYRLCSQQFSFQSHYDYGMRAVKTVLTAAGHLKLNYPNEDEQVLLLQAIVDVNRSKLLDQDALLFEGIISDMFPGVKSMDLDYTDVYKAMEKVCKTRNLQCVDYFKKKIMETYEMMKVRHGFMLVGEPFSGKTSALTVLAGTLIETGVPINFVTINPKSVTMEQLYGQFDPISYEWTDGILSVKFRDFVRDRSTSRNWLILDGPVDAVWIENLNTVLDDNKKLCLNSGEVIVMSSSMSLVFEVLDLNQASPATVSRCGMIYMEPKALGWEVLARSWLVKQETTWLTELSDTVWDLITWLVPPSLNFLRKNCVMLANFGDSSKVSALLSIVTMLVTDACRNPPLHLGAWVQAALVYGGVWGLGGSLNQNSRVLFNEFYLELWRGNVEEYPVPESIGKVEISLPSDGIMYDYCYVFRGKGNWRQCADILKQEKLEEPLNLAQMLVPTIDTIKYTALLELHINHNIPLMFVGGTGSGKSFLTQNVLLTKLDQNLFLPAFLTFTALTSANDTQKLIISKLNKRKRGIYGPPKGQRCVCFIDDVSIPAKEVYGAQPPVELIRQFLDSGNWFDLKSAAPLYLHDILFCTAMGLPGGSRGEVTSRFLRHFNVFAMNDPSEESLSRIFSTVLFSNFKRNGFASDAMTAVTSIVNATMDAYHSSLEELRPTPAKSHYLFNLRDFSKVIQGCALIKKESVDSRKVFARLWVHETLRVFYDRLIDDSDREWMHEKIGKCVREHMKENFDSLFDHLKLENGVCTEATLRDLMFGEFLDPDALESDRKYEELASVDQLNDVATAVMTEYNATHNSKLDLVLFRYALEHLSRVCRILSLPGGSGLLVGVSGSGRQSLSVLATAIMGYSFFQPEITTSYSTTEWRNDLKKVLKDAGGRAKSTTFLFSEAQIKDETFLCDIDSLLNLGEVPELFGLDEKQEILEMVRLAAQGGNRNLDISPLAVFNFFVARCKQKLHILLCFSPIGGNFRNRLRLFSSLVNCCTIDWFFDWPIDALEMIATRHIVTVNLPDIVKTAAISVGKYYHTSAKELSTEFYQKTNKITYITTSAFLELISLFAKLMTKTQEETKASKLRYIAGLEKLEYAADQVTTMSKALSELKPKLEIAKAQTVEMMEKIENEKKKVESAAALVKQDEKVANEQAAASASLKSECEAELAQAIPILEEAIAALNTLKPTDITLVKSMKNPPDAIKLVMAAVCVMRDVKPDRVPDPATGRKVFDYWGPSKRILGDMAFLQQLKEYDKDNIAPEIMLKIRKEYIPHKDFKPNIVAKASSAAEGLCKWVIAMDLYDSVAKEVAPKKAKLQVAENEYAATMVLLNQKRAEVNKLEEQLGELMQKLMETQERKQKLEEDVDLCASKLFRAEKLIDGLGGEKSRWENAATQLQANYDSLAGDILICCAVISYLSPFTLAYRVKTVSDWYAKCKELDIPCSEEYAFSKVLGSEVKIQNWHICGLPRDEFSVENAIILDSSDKWPLLIDPQGQANRWIKTMERMSHLEVVKITDANYMNVVVDCIQYGKPILIENIQEHLDPALNPVLNKNVYSQHGKLYISLKDDAVEYNPNFKLYLTSCLRNPHYLPEIFNQVRVINFALTMEGLEDQLLGIVVAKERPDLQAKRQELIIKSAENKKSLLQVENMILQTLSGTKGNILEDETAIETLDSSKILSQSIKIEQESAQHTESVIESFRSKYRPIAAHSAVLYYCIVDLVNIDPMYQYSLTWFINLFLSSIDSANKSKILEKRLRFLREAFTYDLYSNVCRSLFEKDKLLFSFILCCYVMIAEGKLDRSDFLFFLTGGMGGSTLEPNPCSDWLRDQSWQEINKLLSITVFERFVDHFRLNFRDWKKFYDLKNPSYDMIPPPWRGQLSSFQALILLKIFRPDKVIPNVGYFVKSELGEEFTKPPTFDLNKSFNDSSCLCPLVFILSPGSDPMGMLQAFAEKKGLASKLESVSMGQGQGTLAVKLITTAQAEGTWVCLQNCHLAPSWMPTLEKIWEGMDSTNTHMNFRLWLTSYPSSEFPSRVLQNSVKMTNEAPTELQQNIYKSFTSSPINDLSFFGGCPGKNKVFGKLLYGLTFFHAVVQERRKFGPIGWNIPYGFDESDFLISIRQLQTFLMEYSETPFEAITYLTGECNYGGKVTDDWDRRTLLTLLSEFISKKVVAFSAYTFAPGSSYGLPRKTSYDDYLEHIKNLPAESAPEVVGLHPNAGITQGLQSTKKLLENILLVEGSTFQSSKSFTTLLEKSKSILSILPENFDVDAALLKYPVRYKECMNALFIQELERFNILLNAIKRSLRELEKAVQGFVVMSPALDLLSQSLQLSQVPVVWRKVSYPTLKPLGSYVNDLLERLKFFQKWLELGIPSCFWMSGFYSTHGFLTSVLQNYARKYKIPIDELTFDFAILKESLELKIPTDGALAYGLFLDGGRWDRVNNRLEELWPTVLHDNLPVVWLKPVRKSDLDEKGRYKCPVYKTLDRRGTLSTTGISTNFVIPFLLETKATTSHWVKRGVALFCQLDD